VQADARGVRMALSSMIALVLLVILFLALDKPRP
jgi:hypothetical protein